MSALFGIAPYLIVGLLLFAGIRGLLLTESEGVQIEGQSFTQDVIAPLRPLLILFVVAGHCDSMTGCSNLVLRALHMGTPAVAVFFFISGYGLLASYEKRGSRYLHGFCRRCIVKLFVPMGLAVVAYQFVYALWGDEAFSHRSWDVIKNGYIDCLLPHCWFVFAIAYMYMTFKIAYGLLHGRCAIFVASALVFVYVAGFIAAPHCWWLTSISFIFGLLYRKYEGVIVDIVSRYSWMLYFSLALIYSGCVVLALHGGLVGIMFKMASLSLGGPLIAVFFLSSPVKCTWSWLLVLSAVSFETYLVHGIPKELLARFQLQPIVYFCLVYVISVVMATGLKWISVPIKNRVLKMVGVS